MSAITPTRTPYARAAAMVARCELDMKLIINRLSPFSSSYDYDCLSLKMTFNNWHLARTLMLDIEVGNG